MTGGRNKKDGSGRVMPGNPARQAHGVESALRGKSILVTRAAGQAEGLVREIRRYGGTPVLFPTIQIEPAESCDDCDRAIDSIAQYHGLIFTSANGVRYFCERCNRRGTPIGAFRSMMICVVGEQTRQAAAGLGLAVTVMPKKSTAVGLTERLAQENLEGKRFLFPRGNLGDDAVRSRLGLLGAVVDCVVVYRTGKARPENLQEVRAMLLAGKIDVLTFTSGSTFRNFVSLFSEADIMQFRPLTRIAAIGPSTASAISRSGMVADISPPESLLGSGPESGSESGPESGSESGSKSGPESSAESLVYSIVRYYRPRANPGDGNPDPPVHRDVPAHG
jgi:uroporphyrinogen III methyltransferase/synthase